MGLAWDVVSITPERQRARLAEHPSAERSRVTEPV
jgi:hypothetical protein